MNKIINRETMSYIFFGILTTVVYFLSRFTIINLTDNSMLSVTIAQISAILFAYITNKIFVFRDSNWHFLYIIKQLLGFVLARLFVFILDLSVTFLAVETYSKQIINFMRLDSINYDSMLFSSALTKNIIGSKELLNEFIFALIVQVLAIILNYIISKKAIFKNK